MSFTPHVATIVKAHAPECGADMKKQFGTHVNLNAIMDKGWPETCAKIKYAHDGKDYTVPSFTSQSVGESMAIFVRSDRPDRPVPRIDPGTYRTVAEHGTALTGGASTTSTSTSTSTTESGKKKNMGVALGIGGGVILSIFLIAACILMLILILRRRSHH